MTLRKIVGHKKYEFRCDARPSCDASIECSESDLTDYGWQYGDGNDTHYCGSHATPIDLESIRKHSIVLYRKHEFGLYSYFQVIDAAVDFLIENGFRELAPMTFLQDLLLRNSRSSAIEDLSSIFGTRLIQQIQEWTPMGKDYVSKMKHLGDTVLFCGYAAPSVIATRLMQARFLKLIEASGSLPYMSHRVGLLDKGIIHTDFFRETQSDFESMLMRVVPDTQEQQSLWGLVEKLRAEISA